VGNDVGDAESDEAVPASSLRIGAVAGGEGDDAMGGFTSGRAAPTSASRQAPIMAAINAAPIKQDFNDMEPDSIRGLAVCHAVFRGH